MRYCTSIGIDTHAKKNEVCALDTQTGEMSSTTLSDDPAQLITWITQQSFTQPLCCCYEAGPTGFNLARTLKAAGIECLVVATSKLPQRIDRQKNDRLDAEWLARMLIAGSVRSAHIPSIEEESLCHLSRLRGEVASDLRRAKQRARSFLLVTRTSYTLTKKYWTKTFYQWADSHEFSCPADSFTFRHKVSAILRLQERLSQIEAEIMRIINSDPALASKMARFTCIHGIGDVTAFSLVCEVYDFKRFSCGSAFASFIGLVPSENSSGQKTAHGKLTKTGNSHLRRLLVEVANHYSRPFKIIKEERADVPEIIRVKAEKCSVRLKKRRFALKERGVMANKVKIAIARELCEWIYYIAVMPA